MVASLVRVRIGFVRPWRMRAYVLGGGRARQTSPSALRVDAAGTFGKPAPAPAARGTTFRRSAVLLAALGASDSELSALADPRSLDRFELDRWRATARQYSGPRQTDIC